jgi:hypothetical protein
VLYDEAKRKILIHAGYALSDEDVGFLGRLRPYTGIRERDFADVVECLVSIHPTVVRESRVERELCAAIWSLCELTRVLIADRHGKLRTNKLITDADLERLRAWTDAIEVFAVRMLSGLDLGYCVSHVAQYLSAGAVREPSDFQFLVPLFEDVRRRGDDDIREIAADALRALRAGG